MTTDFTKAINASGSIKPTTANTPLDVRTRIESISEVENIPLPFIGMIFYVIDEDKYYSVKTLKGQTIAGTTKPNMLIDTYSELATGGSGSSGADGKSAYQIAVENGFTGTEVEWLASLKGADGTDGTSADVPVATTSTAGKVKPDGTTITVTSDGTISAQTADSATITSAVNLYMESHPVSAEVGDGSVTEKKLATELKDSLYNIKYSGSLTKKDYSFTLNDSIMSGYICSIHPKFNTDVAMTDFTIKLKGTVTLELWEIGDSGAKFIRTVDTIEGDASLALEYHYIFDKPFIIRSNQMLFIKGYQMYIGAQISRLTSLNPNFNTNDIWGLISESTVSNGSTPNWYISTMLHGYYSIYNYYTLSDGYTYQSSIKESLDKNKSEVSSLKDIIGKYPYTTVYNKDLTEISSDFVNQDTAWSVTSDSTGVTTTTTNKYLRLNKIYYANRRFIEIRAALNSDTILKISTTGLGNSSFYVDVANNKAYYNIGWSNIFETTFSNLTLTAGKEYIIRTGIENESLWYSVTDYLTGESEYRKEKMSKNNKMFFNGNYYLTLHSGSWVTIKNININIINNPTLYITGDSITVGSSMNDFTKRYGAIIRENDIPDATISAEGGIQVRDLLNLFESEIKYIKPKFVMATYGANNSLDELKNPSYGYPPVITKFEEAGIPLYINSITCNSTYNSGTSTYSAYNKHSEKNEYIRSLGKKGARLDIATAVDNIPDTTEENDDRCNHDLYEDTYLHPNEAGNEAIYERIKADLPELFM